MNDKEFLGWLVDRLVNVYGEDKNIDFVVRLRAIAGNMEGGKINDKEFLGWLVDRLVNVYGEDKNVDFVVRLRAIQSCK